MTRCFLCDHRIEPAPARVTCPLCGIAFDPAGRERAATELAALLDRAGLAVPSSGLTGASGWTLPLAGLRMAASRAGRQAIPAGLARFVPLPLLDRLAGRIRVALAPRPAGTGAKVALGCIARTSEAGALDLFVERYAGIFAQFIFMLDGPEAEARAIADHLRTLAPGADIIVRAHALAGDFSAQRNRAQALCTVPWIIQLDTDEQLDRGLIESLGAVAAEAEVWGTSIVGFPRANLVDGQLSNFYPDVQYRLTRAHVCYHRRVHETPLDGAHWRQVAVSLAGRIEHQLSRARVVERSREYEAIAEGGGKPQDESWLLEAYEA
jgi:hypothetical protein